MTAVRRDLPSGTVTFLFTDVEGSTRLLYEVGAEAYAAALAEHRRAIREACSRNGGVEVDTEGDAFFAAFPTASGALAAAVAITDAHSSGPIQVRMGLHTGTPLRTDEGYVGDDVHRAARIAACGHGGQLLLSDVTAALLGRGGLRDLGEHRLKDLSAPENIYQLGDAAFPPLRSLHQTNLPIPTTPFLGRQKELAEILGLLTKEDVRLLTLTGPGGTGKTRLATQAGAELGPRYPNGVWFVPLAPLRDPGLVLQAAGQALGVQDGLAEHIADRSMLLLFDNFEHVVAAAGDVAGLLAACPHLDLLVTSREPLHVSGEQEYTVPPFVHEEAVGFFLARARAVKPDFGADDAVSEICRRLDDLPLALELAAARVKALSSRQILERLEQRLPLLTGGARDLPERQRTLRAAIAWSYELLEPAEQRLFGRLAVFRGGCTLEAAEEVADADLDSLQSLVDKSLLRHTEDRFWMLDTIREYAFAWLESSGDAEYVQRRHAEHFLALAEEVEPNLRGSGRTGLWLDRLEREHENLQAAFDRLEASGESDRATRLAGAVSWFWTMFGTVAGLCRVAVALSHQGDALTAVRLLSCAEALSEEIGYRASWLTAMNDETLTAVRSQIDAGAFAEAWQQGQTLSVDEAVALAFDS
jgi:predicted ATPase/class 3 adenylate cyclase